MPTEIIREIVSELRNRRLRGASPSELVHFLEGLGLDRGGIKGYMTDAFCLQRAPNTNLIMRDRSGAFLDTALDAAFGPPIDAARDAWTTAGPYPDLIRRQDRHAFKEVARELDLIIFVRPASPSIERYVGQEGFRPHPPLLEGVARTREPNAGLIAADPENPELLRLLEWPERPRSYEEYRRQLESSGFGISSPAEGYIVRDGVGTAFYPGYTLQGVYSASNGKNAWTTTHGEKIRARLNLRLGEQLVQSGPYDLWAHRDSKPRLPVLMFHAEGIAYVIWDAGLLAAEYKFRKIDWDSLYANNNPSTVGKE